MQIPFRAHLIWDIVRGKFVAGTISYKPGESRLFVLGHGDALTSYEVATSLHEAGNTLMAECFDRMERQGLARDVPKLRELYKKETCGR